MRMHSFNRTLSALTVVSALAVGGAQVATLSVAINVK